MVLPKEELNKAGISQEKIEQFDQALGEIAGKMLKGGMSPKEAMGISGKYLENMYAQAYRLYNTGKYTEASHVFRMLIILNAMEPKYSLGLAACLHMLKEYYDAIQTYTMCTVLDPQTPLPFYHSADCFIQMKDYLSAMVCLELAIKRAESNPIYDKMKERAHMSLASLKEKLGSVSADAEKEWEKELEKRGGINKLLSPFTKFSQK